MKNHINLLVKVFITSFTFVLISCTSDSTGPDGLGQFGETFAIAFVDSAGQDLLDKETPNYWTKYDLKIYYLIEGEIIRSDHVISKPYWIYDPDNYEGVQDSNCHMELLLSSYLDEDGFSTTFIEFPGGEMDTLKLKGRLVRNTGFLGDTLWYNEDLVWIGAKPGGEIPDFNYINYLTIQKDNVK